MRAMAMAATAALVSCSSLSQAEPDYDIIGKQFSLVLQNGHFSRARFTQEKYEKFLECYVQSLDTQHLFLTQEDVDYLQVSFSIIRDYPQTQYSNLSIPTWLYGHEWTSPFATHIAKLFENSVREDTLLTVAYGGIVYAPGRAGTIQEVFQEAVQNHYLTFGFASPMVFLDTEFWSKTTPFYPLLVDLLEKGIYKNLLLSLTDDVEEVIRIIRDFQQKCSVSHIGQ